MLPKSCLISLVFFDWLLVCVFQVKVVLNVCIYVILLKQSYSYYKDNIYISYERFLKYGFSEFIY